MPRRVTTTEGIDACRDCQAPATYGMPNYLDTDGNVVCPDCARKDPDIYTGYLDAKHATTTSQEA